MQISFTDEIFESTPAHKIVSAIYTAIDQHHEIMVDFTGSHFSKWLSHCEANVDPELPTLLSYALGTSIFVGSKRFIEVVKAPSKKHQVTFDELTTVLLRSFFIYVENGRADKRFIYSLLPPELRRDVQHQVKIGAIVFENAGGITELSRKIADDYQTRAKLSLRAFALFDSDALAPQTPSKDAIEAITTCDMFDIPHYCLSRRAIENYIPNEALLVYAKAGNTEDQRNQRKRIARAVARLSEEQKSHFHMKDGFSAPHGPLYENLNDTDRATLSSGFGSHLSDCYNDGGIVDRKSLESSGGWEELQGLVSMMMEVL
jgi:hypothetical protein